MNPLYRVFEYGGIHLHTFMSIIPCTSSFFSWYHENNKTNYSDSIYFKQPTLFILMKPTSKTDSNLPKDSDPILHTKQIKLDLVIHQKTET